MRTDWGSSTIGLEVPVVATTVTVPTSFQSHAYVELEPLAAAAAVAAVVAVAVVVAERVDCWD